MGRINKTQFAVLGVLLVRSMSAYDIKQFMARTTAHFWTESEGQLYPTLKKLTEGGYVTVKHVPSEKGLEKKIYSITPSGQARFSEWMSADTGRLIYRNELLLKVFFGSFVEKQITIDLLETAKNETEQQLTQLKAICQELTTKMLPTKRSLFISLTLDAGIISLRAEIEWCETSILKLRDFNETDTTTQENTQ